MSWDYIIVLYKWSCFINYVIIDFNVNNFSIHICIHACNKFYTIV